jgi:GR25 family glycosyltransferase involved in LPS biosynthesis
MDLVFFFAIAILLWFAYVVRTTFMCWLAPDDYPVALRTIERFAEYCINPGIPVDDFDVYVINLDRNKSRLGLFMEQYAVSDISVKKVKRIAAADGRKINIAQYISDTAYKEIQTIETTGFRTKHYQLTRGAVGCYLSHLKAYSLIKDSPDKSHGLIFEDDVNIAHDFFFKLNRLLRNIPNDWDVLLLGCHCLKCHKAELHSHVQKFILLHCYVVKKDAARRLHEDLSSRPIQQQIDSEISDMITDRKFLNVYCVNEALCWQSGQFATDIQTPVKKTAGMDPYSQIVP